MDTKIMVGIPSNGTIKAQTTRTLLGIAQLPIETLFHFRHGNFSFENREKLADSALEHGCSHLFLVDADMSFEPKVLLDLIALNKDIVGVNYNYRYLPLESTVRLIKDGQPMTGEIPTEPFECYSVGSGCTLIHTQVFKQLKKPYYTWQQDEQGTISATEDVLFCEKAREHAFSVWCDPRHKVSHHGDYAY